MIERLKEMLQEVVADDGLFDLVAQGHMKMYTALTAAGFTEEQAIKIVANQGIGVKTR